MNNKYIFETKFFFLSTESIKMLEKEFPKTIILSSNIYDRYPTTCKLEFTNNEELLIFKIKYGHKYEK